MFGEVWGEERGEKVGETGEEISIDGCFPRLVRGGSIFFLAVGEDSGAKLKIVRKERGRERRQY